MHDSRLGRWFAIDPSFRKYPGLSVYNYVLNNPIIMIDPNGEDPIFGKNFWGKVRYIGDDGKKNGKVYLVKGRIKRAVLRASKKGDIYTGTLADRNRVVKIPTDGVLDDVVDSVNDTEKSNRENGGHAEYGAENAVRWDEGPAVSTTKEKIFVKNDKGEKVEREVTMTKGSVSPFIVDGEFYSVDFSYIEYFWHTHPFGDEPSEYEDSNGKKGDVPYQRYMKTNGFKEIPFLINIKSKKVTFYNENGVIMRIKYSDFIRMRRIIKKSIKINKINAVPMKTTPRFLNHPTTEQ